jgi:hypothetical protein
MKTLFFEYKSRGCEFDPLQFYVKLLASSPNVTLKIKGLVCNFAFHHAHHACFNN